MTFYTTAACAATHTKSSDGHRADFARQATIDAFGWRYAKALDQADFADRRPGELPGPVNNAP